MEQPRGRREAERRVRMKTAEAPRQNHREPRKLDEPEPGGRQSREPGRPPKAPNRAGRMDWVGAAGKTEELDPTAKAGESDDWTPTPEDPEGHKQAPNNER